MKPLKPLFIFVLLLSLTQTLSAQEKTEELQAGPNVTDATKAPKVVAGEKGRTVDAASLANIDLTKTPWLCESVGLSPTHPAFLRPRMIWADSTIYKTLPEIIEDKNKKAESDSETKYGDGKITDGIIVERWVSEPPKDLAGKYVFVEHWATWCPPCRRSLPLLNYFHEKYKDDLVIVSICETDEKAIKEMTEPLKLADIKFHLAVDTNRRFADLLGVYGIPHAVLIEPVSGAVIWEGMPTQPRYELDDKTIEKILTIGKKLKAAGKVPEKSPLRFVEVPADPNWKPKHSSTNASW